MSKTWGRCALALVLTSACLVSDAADKATKRSSKSMSKPEAAEAEAVLTGRLPRYFASVVDSKQRQEIYEIQASFQTKIEELEAELAALEEEQMKEIEGVLTTTQRKKLVELREARESSGKTKSTSRSSTSRGTKSSSKSKSKD
ncbi:MAG: hypothetical protein ACR2NZ_04945 [Rubripirellula sp.]